MPFLQIINFLYFVLIEGQAYTYLNLYEPKKVMETLYPIRSPNKIINYFISNLSYNAIYLMEKEIIRYEENLKEASKAIYYIF